MDYIIIRKVDFTKNILLEKLNKYLFNYLKNTNTYIFDIHKTIEYGDNNMDEVIFNFINKNHDKVNIILLSYDGNDERIISNNNKLDEYSKIFKKIPKIFIKKRKKHYIIGYVAKLLNIKFNSYKKISFFDDNYLNITDAKKIVNNIPGLEIIHYTAHSNRKSDEAIDDITKILKIN